MQEFFTEIKFKTARSGGKGGQHVNKVETMVEGFWNIEESAAVSPEEKALIWEKLSNKINNKGELMVKSQASRSQLGNKELVIKKMRELVRKALEKRKKRKPTKPTAQSREKRLESKKKTSEIKAMRRKISD